MLLDIPGIVGPSLLLAQCGTGWDSLCPSLEPSYSRGYIHMFRWGVWDRVMRTTWEFIVRPGG